MIRVKKRLSTKAESKGFALFITMMLLLALMIVSMAFLQNSSLNERMVGNDLDRNRAYQAAEATIRDAQRDINRITPAGISCDGLLPCRPLTSFPNRDAGSTDLPTGCVAGFCHFTTAMYKVSTFQGPWLDGAPGNTAFAQYGEWSGANWADLSNQIGAGVQLSRRPRYWVEILEPTLGNSSYRYRITSVAWGLNANTSVTLQEVYAPGID
jgi:type IV pilus assembly protein PilX